MRWLHLLIWYPRVPILWGLHFEIEPWEWVFIHGKSGSGKSTFLKTLAWLLKPLSGTLMDEHNQDIYKLSAPGLRKYRRSCGIVADYTPLIQSKTIEQNISYALEICGYSAYTIKNRTKELLKHIDLYDKRNQYIDTLSSGECERVIIARALIHEPAILLVDEPTWNLDQYNTLKILDYLKQLHTTGTTIIFATHNQSLTHLVPHSRVLDLDALRHASSLK